MKDNPYSKMIEIMKNKGASFNPPSIQIGEVIEPPPNLVVKVNDLQIDKDNILIADYLLEEHQRKITIKGENIHFTQSTPVGTTDSVNDGGTGASSHSHDIDNIEINTPVQIGATNESSYIQTEDTLKKGDLLGVMPVEDRQLYIVIARLKGVS